MGAASGKNDAGIVEGTRVRGLLKDKAGLFAVLAIAAAFGPFEPARAQSADYGRVVSAALYAQSLQEKDEDANEPEPPGEQPDEAEPEDQRNGRDSHDIDEPGLRPLVFGPTRTRDDADDDPTGTRITLGKEDDNRGFFSALNFLVPEETNLSVGVGPVYEPDYYGSDDYEFNPDPQVYVKFRNFVFLDDDGADFALFGFSGFRAGPTLRIRQRRNDAENPALQGLGDVGATFEFGGFAATTFQDRFAFKAKVRHGLKTGHRGTIVDGYLTALLFRAGPVSMAASGEASWIGNRYADAYFSVTPEQSAASGGRLPEFNANAGFRDVGGTLTAYINIRDRWSLNPYATYLYIMDDIAATPIISEFGERHQFKVGFHLMREFQFGFK